METHEFSELMAHINEIRARLDKLEAEPEATKSKASLEEVLLYCAKCGLAENDGRWFFAKMECNAWRNNGKIIKSWQHCITAWKLASIFPSQKNGHSHQRPSVFELKTVLEIKREEAQALANKHYNNSGAFPEWTSEPARQSYIILKREIKDLINRIAGSV